MTNERRRNTATSHTGHVQPKNRWAGPTILMVLVLVPIGILVFSNLRTETIRWLGFEFTAPLWLILIVTFGAGMIGGKLGGWAWRRFRRRRQRLKEELAALRRHAASTDKSNEPDGDEG